MIEATYQTLTSSLKLKELTSLEDELKSLPEIPGIVERIADALAAGRDADLPEKFFSYITAAFKKGQVPFSTVAIASQIFDLRREKRFYTVYPFFKGDGMCSPEAIEFLESSLAIPHPGRHKVDPFLEAMRSLSSSELFIRKSPFLSYREFGSLCTDPFIDEIDEEAPFPCCRSRAGDQLLLIAPTASALFLKTITPHPQKCLFYFGPSKISQMREAMKDKGRPVILSYPTAPSEIVVHQAKTSWTAAQMHDLGFHAALLSFVPKQITSFFVELEAKIQERKPKTQALKQIAWDCLDFKIVHIFALQLLRKEISPEEFGCKMLYNTILLVAEEALLESHLFLDALSDLLTTREDFAKLPHEKYVLHLRDPKLQEQILQIIRESA